MPTFKQLIESGFEIKAASVIALGPQVEQHIFVQKGGDAYVCIFRRQPNGTFAAVGAWSIA